MHIKTNNLYFLNIFDVLLLSTCYSCRRVSYNEIPLSSHAGNYFEKKKSCG